MGGRLRDRMRPRAWPRRGGPSYDPDAAAYIDATGELFPDALNTLVLGIKAAGLWDDHLGSIKKAIGVPSLAASMVDLRNPAFVGTAYNTPTHSATEGWGFTAASSQYIDSGWQCGVTDSKGSLNSVHVGLRAMASSAGIPTATYGPNVYFGFHQFGNGTQYFDANGALGLQTTQNPVAPGHYIGTRTGPNAKEVYRAGASIASDTGASIELSPYNIFIGARNLNGSPQSYFTGRITLAHYGAGLNDAQAAALTALFDAYATAAGEA